MSEALGSTPTVFFGFTCVFVGFVAYMTGQAVATTWKPLWQALAYTLLLGAADRFLVFALFDGVLLSWSGYLIDTAVLCVIASLAHRIALARTMVMQYPWLYTRAGPFGWRARDPHADG